MKKSIVKNILVFVLVFVLCFILKILVCAIPSERISENLNASVVSQDITNHYFMPWSRSDSNRIQIWPEYDYLNYCLTLDPNRPVYSALMNPIIDGDTGIGGGAGRYSSLVQGGTSVLEFSVYPFGAITILRPLLYFIKYDNIIDIIIIIGWMLIFVCFFKISQISNKFIAFIFLLSLLLININIVFTTVSTTLVFLIAFCGILWLSHVKTSEDEITVFLIIGLLTGFFDWFTTPIVTFAYPAFYAFLKYMMKSKHIIENDKKVRNSGFITMIKSAIAWCFGYGGMIIGKVIITSLYSKQNLISQLFMHFTDDINKENIAYSENIIEYILTTIKKSFELVRVVDIMPKFLIVLIIFVSIVAACLYIIKSLQSKEIDLLVLFASMLAPFAWLIVFHGHIYVHLYWDYRILGPTLCAVGTMLYILAVIVKKKVLREYGRDRKGYFEVEQRGNG